jgi:hypothetical protein
MIGELNRFGQDGLGASFSSKLANTTMRLSGLNAITDARKRAFGVTMMDAIGSLTRTVADVKKLDPTDWRMLRSKGISDKDWKIWRLAQVEKWNDTNSTMLTPESIARIPTPTRRGRAHAEGPAEGVLKLLGAVLEEVDVAVISPGARERAMMGAGIQRGTMKGELARSFWLFKSFPMAMITRHWMRGNGMETAGGKAAYIASLVMATTVLGALSLEVDQVLQGKDPRTLNPIREGRRARHPRRGAEGRVARHLWRLPLQRGDAGQATKPDGSGGWAGGRPRGRGAEPHAGQLRAAHAGQGDARRRRGDPLHQGQHARAPISGTRRRRSITWSGTRRPSTCRRATSRACARARAANSGRTSTGGPSSAAPDGGPDLSRIVGQ